jgi:hypothetical protein
MWEYGAEIIRTVYITIYYSSSRCLRPVEQINQPTPTLAFLL